MAVITESSFSQQVVTRVDARLEPELMRRSYRRLHRKALVVIAWYIGSYFLILFAHGWLLGITACVSMAFAIGAVGFNIQHDANHNAFFRTNGSRRLSTANRIAGLSLNAIGGSSKRWIEGHVRQHHVSTNIVGKDYDIELAPFARLAPSQRWRRLHVFQHFYIWVLYGFTTLAIIVMDIVSTVQESISGDRHGRSPSMVDYVVLLTSKALFILFMVVIPLLLHPWWIVVLGAVAVLGLSGFVLGTIFQLAHAVEEADFADDRVPESIRWHQWQVETSVDFCRGDGPVARALTWYAGGLNFQAEHHLFPTLPHTVYPDIAPVVEETCEEFGIRYHAQPTLRAAVRSHYRHVRGLSRPVLEAESPA